MIGQIAPKTGIEPFADLVDHVMTPRALRLGQTSVLDRGQRLLPRRAGSIDRMRAAWPTATLVHLPVHASWLNQVEIYFSILQRKAIDPTTSPKEDHEAVPGGDGQCVAGRGSTNSGSLPVRRTNRGPEASQKASPNRSDELDPHHRLMQVLDCLDEVRLPDHDIDIVRLVDGHQRTRDEPSHSTRTCLREPTHTVEQCVAPRPDLFVS